MIDAAASRILDLTDERLVRILAEKDRLLGLLDRLEAELTAEEIETIGPEEAEGRVRVLIKAARREAEDGKRWLRVVREARLIVRDVLAEAERLAPPTG